LVLGLTQQEAGELAKGMQAASRFCPAKAELRQKLAI
jgi:hypothetical protein